MTASAETLLLACPFCGGTPSMRSGGPGCHFVQCDTCNAASDDHSQERAIAAWNLRAASPAQEQVATATPQEAADDWDDLSAEELAMIDQAWENHKVAVPVATVINDNQPGRTAIIEILSEPPTLPVGTKLYAEPKRIPSPADDRTALLARIADLEALGDEWRGNVDRVVGLMADADRRAADAEAQVAEAVKMIGWIEDACQQLAANRSQTAYDTMIDDGQADELIELDNARRAARAFIAALAGAQS